MSTVPAAERMPAKTRPKRRRIALSTVADLRARGLHLPDPGGVTVRVRGVDRVPMIEFGARPEPPPARGDR